MKKYIIQADFEEITAASDEEAFQKTEQLIKDGLFNLTIVDTEPVFISE